MLEDALLVLIGFCLVLAGAAKLDDWVKAKRPNWIDEGNQR